MSKITPLNSEIHKDLKVKASTDYSRFKKQQLIPVVIQEFSPLATEFPIVFVKNAENGSFIPVAMMGIRSGNNLYCQNELWTSPVTPLGFHNAPFSLAKQNTSSDEAIMCIDLDSPLIQSAQGSELFNNNTQTDYLNKRLQSLLQLSQFTHQTQSVCQIFAEKELLQMQQLSVSLTIEEKAFTIDGIYLIDEQALNMLPTDEFEQLKSKGLLPIIYAHLISLNQLNRLCLKQNEFDVKSM